MDIMNICSLSMPITNFSGESRQFHRLVPICPAASSQVGPLQSASARADANGSTVPLPNFAFHTRTANSTQSEDQPMNSLNIHVAALRAFRYNRSQLHSMIPLFQRAGLYGKVQRSSHTAIGCCLALPTKSCSKGITRDTSILQSVCYLLAVHCNFADWVSDYTDLYASIDNSFVDPRSSARMQKSSIPSWP
jgi:hypothetical protein